MKESPVGTIVEMLAPHSVVPTGLKLLTAYIPSNKLLGYCQSSLAGLLKQLHAVLPLTANCQLPAAFWQFAKPQG
jgi:hypothetical protein